MQETSGKNSISALAFIKIWLKLELDQNQWPIYEGASGADL